MKNESHLIEEWLDHYFSMGVDHVFLIDNGSTDDTVLKVAPWQRDGRVQVISLPEPHQQILHYWSAFQHFRIAERCKWLIVVDIDEFLFCKSGERLGHYLDRQRGIDAIYVNWTVFGSSGWDMQPTSARQSFVMAEPKLSRYTKCIFQPSLFTEYALSVGSGAGRGWFRPLL
ncbi:glycosyltransferase family 2 protein, partial [Tabrizicola sp.]|uniref:glycosyltransferase family 2 protein n=1 Tax=Tabrizicola sp. TaxID=2005166 RepID=UPI0025CE874F